MESSLRKHPRPSAGGVAAPGVSAAPPHFFCLHPQACPYAIRGIFFLLKEVLLP